MKKRLIPIVLFLSLVGLGGLSLVSIHNLQGNARVINYTGVVRGATQRLVKEELKGRTDDALIARLDGIMEELATGVGENRLIRLNDQAYQELLSSMEDQWQVLKEEIMLVRQGKDSQTLFELSESYFQLADTTVTAAEQYTEQQVNRTSRGFGILILGAMGVWGILVWQERRQDKMQAVIREKENANRQQKQRLDRMWDTLRAPLNDISEMMYVSDVETHELLFLNEAGMRNFHLDSIEGKRCYEVFHGLSEPCPFCSEHFTDYGNIVTWENTNPITGRHYLLKDRLIEWNDRPARLEIAFDVTEAEKEKQSLKFALRAEDMLVDCVRSLYEDRGIGEILPVILDKLGRFMNADRSYVFMLRDGKLYNEYEWCAGGVESQMDTLQGLPLEFIDRWLKIFDRQECMVLEDVQDLKEDYRNEYEILTAQGITSLVAAPLERDGHFCGAIGVDNPPLEQLVNIGPLLRTLGYFLMLSYRRDENEKELNRLSYHDTLTSFYNRNRYIADTDNLRETQSPVGIVYLDVNGLKDINDLRGHAFGDKVLVECARRMRETFEGADFYRIGGDEFVIICREWSKEVFEEKVELLRKNFERDSICRAAVGSRWAEGSDDLSQIIADADARMYEDKKEFYRRSPVSRRYRHQSDEVINLSNPEVLADELGKNHFVVYVQPKVSSADRSAVGAEALIRYQSKEGSMVLPGNFLPLLEEAQTISQVDFFVFEFICSKVKEWADREKQAFPVSVNFSRFSLAQPSFVEQLVKLCDKYGISPGLLEIEITESIRNAPEIDLKELIGKLRQAGFTVALDDFGTEYVNLSLLSSVEFDVLKLDKTMVDDMVNNPKAQAIIESIAGICKKMGIRVVAEGIETEEQMSVLRTCGVETAQGYLFSRPIPVEEYEEKYL